MGGSSQVIKKKGIQTGQEEVKLLLFTDCIIIYVENRMESIKKATRVMKVAGSTYILVTIRN